MRDWKYQGSNPGYVHRLNGSQFYGIRDVRWLGYLKKVPDEFLPLVADCHVIQDHPLFAVMNFIALESLGMKWVSLN